MYSQPHSCSGPLPLSALVDRQLRLARDSSTRGGAWCINHLKDNVEYTVQQRLQGAVTAAAAAAARISVASTLASSPQRC